MPMAWLMSSVPQTDVQEDDDLSERPDTTTINYWATRLTPYLREKAMTDASFYFVCCNRTGTEQGSRFAGSSCALRFSSSRQTAASQVTLLGTMSRRESVGVFTLEM